MEIFSFVEEQGPEYIGYMTDAGRVLTWVPISKQKWCVHIWGESIVDDKYMRNLDDALRRILKPHKDCIDIAAHIKELHGCDPFEDVNDTQVQDG